MMRLRGWKGRLRGLELMKGSKTGGEGGFLVEGGV